MVLWQSGPKCLSLPLGAEPRASIPRHNRGLDQQWNKTSLCVAGSP